MSNTYSVSWRIWNWTNKLLYCLLDVIMLHSYIILPCYGIRLDYQKYHLTLVQNFLELSAMESHNQIHKAVNSPALKPPTQVIHQLQDHI